MTLKASLKWFGVKKMEEIGDKAYQKCDRCGYPLGKSGTGPLNKM